MIFRSFCFVFSFAIISIWSFAQKTKLRSPDQTSDSTEQVDDFNQLAYKYINIYPDSGIYFAQKGLNLAKKIEYTKGLAHSYLNLGDLLQVKGEYDLAIDNLNSAFSEFQRMEDPFGQAQVYNALGIVTTYRGDYINAIKYLQKAYYLSADNFDSVAIAQNFVNVAVVYRQIGDFEEAFSHIADAKVICEKFEMKLELSKIYNHLADLHIRHGDLNKVLEYSRLAIPLMNEIQNNLGLAEMYRYVGVINKLKGDYELSLEYFSKSLELNLYLGDRKNLGESYREMGEVLLELNKLENSLLHFQKAEDLHKQIGYSSGELKARLNKARYYQLKSEDKLVQQISMNVLIKSKQLGLKEQSMDAAQILSESYMRMNDYRKALEYNKVYHIYKDILLGSQNAAQLNMAEMRNEIGILLINNKLLNKDNVLKELAIETGRLELERKNSTLYMMALIILLITTLAVMWYLSQRSKRNMINTLEQSYAKISEQAKNLKEANEEIVTINESLEYTVNERTKEILYQRDKIKEYAFSNAHNVRGPLARLLGLLNLFGTKGLSEEETLKIENNIKSTADELDHVVRQNSKNLEEID